MKKLNLSLLIILAFLSIIGFVGCKDPEPAHEHTFSEEWSGNATHHWKWANCGCDVVSEKAKHSFGEWTTTKAATEEADGSKERSCSICGYTATEAIEKLAHTHKFATDWTKDETHHWYAATCEHTTEVSGKAAHSFGNWTTTKAATEEAEGSKERNCTVCGYTATEVIAKLEHKYAEEWSSDAIYHWHACNCGKKQDVAEHTYTNGICVCGLPDGFVLILAGTFQMGSNAGNSDNKPVHNETITKPFYMRKSEITQGEYEKYCTYGSSSPSADYGDGNNYPAYYVSWYDAIVYCNKRSIGEGLNPCYSISGNTDPSAWGSIPNSNNSTWDAVVCDWNANGYRLPTEAEWEYAARAGDNTVDALTYSGTNDVNKLVDYAWYYDNSYPKTCKVETKKANEFGLYDMSGNVSEWCWNWYSISYTEERYTVPTGNSSISYRVYRGGFCYKNAEYCSISCREYSHPGGRAYAVGFRVVRSAN